MGARQMVAKLRCSPPQPRRPRLAGSSALRLELNCSEMHLLAHLSRKEKGAFAPSHPEARPFSVLPQVRAGPRKGVRGVDAGLMAPAADGQLGFTWRVTQGA